jgi:hypothetical protein
LVTSIKQVLDFSQIFVNPSAFIVKGFSIATWEILMAVLKPLHLDFHEALKNALAATVPCDFWTAIGQYSKRASESYENVNFAKSKRKLKY